MYLAQQLLLDSHANCQYLLASNLCGPMKPILKFYMRKLYEEIIMGDKCIIFSYCTVSWQYSFNRFRFSHDLKFNV